MQPLEKDVKVNMHKKNLELKSLKLKELSKFVEKLMSVTVYLKF